MFSFDYKKVYDCKLYWMVTHRAFVVTYETSVLTGEYDPISGKLAHEVVPAEQTSAINPALHHVPDWDADSLDGNESEDWDNFLKDYDLDNDI